MLIASQYFHKIILICLLLILSFQQCPANNKLPLFFKNDIDLSAMRQQRVTAETGTKRAYYYVSNFPIQLITRTTSANIDVILSIQKIETSNLLNGINYRIRQIKSQTSLLVTMQSYDIQWKQLKISALLFSKTSYTHISLGEVYIPNSQLRTSLTQVTSSKISLSSTSSVTKTVTFITGMKILHSMDNNYNTQISVTDTFNANSKQYSIIVSVGTNTKLMEIYINYIIYQDVNSADYQIQNGAFSFANMAQGQFVRYMGQNISTADYFIAGISSLKYKQGTGIFSYTISQKTQNALSLFVKNPFTLIKLSFFRISVTYLKACASCGSNSKLLAVPSQSALCSQFCSQGIQASNGRCLICPSELNFVPSQADGKCVCMNGLTALNGQCLSAADAQQFTLNTATFSRFDADCTDSNAVLGPDGTCKCKTGYQNKLAYNKQQCWPICNNLAYYNGQTCINCSVGTYPWPQIQACLPCTSDCQVCQSQFACLTCVNGFQVNATNQCSQICGDGIRIYSQCDDGNLIDGDGCSLQCKVQFGSKCDSPIGGKSVCSNQNYNCFRVSSAFVSGNLIIEYNMKPAPPKLYSPVQLQQIMKIKFKQSPPYQNYLVQKQSDPSIFRIIATYGGNAPVLPALADVQIKMPNNQIFKDTINQNFLKISARTFARRGSDPRTDTLG